LVVPDQSPASRGDPGTDFGRSRGISYLEADQRQAITDWAARLKTMLEQFLADGIADRSIVPCEPALVVQLLLGMLIWLGKWVPSVEGMTVDRLMNAIGAFSLDGLERRS